MLESLLANAKGNMAYQATSLEEAEQRIKLALLREDNAKAIIIAAEKNASNAWDKVDIVRREMINYRGWYERFHDRAAPGDLNSQCGA